MQTLMNIGSGIKITAQHALEIFSDQLLDHFSSPRMVVFVIPDRWGRNAPDGAVDAIFAPTGFIGLHCRAGADLCFEATEHRLRMLHSRRCKSSTSSPRLPSKPCSVRRTC